MTRNRPTLFERLGRRSKVWGLVSLGLFALLLASRAFARFYLAEPFGTYLAVGFGTSAVLAGIARAAIWLQDRLADQMVRNTSQVLTAVTAHIAAINAQRIQDWQRQPRSRFHLRVAPEPPPEHPVWSQNTDRWTQVYPIRPTPALANDPVPPIDEQIRGIDPDSTGDITKRTS